MATTIRIGNTAARHDDKTWDWTLYIRGAVHFIEEATVELHPTFKNPVRTLRGSTLELSARGWGVFPIDVTITWHGGTQLRMKWDLQFALPDAHEEIKVPPQVVPVGPCAKLQAPEPVDSDSGMEDVAGEGDVDAAPEDDAPPPKPELLLRDTSAGTADGDPGRSSLCARLRETSFMEPTDALFKHGRLYNGPMKPPRVVWASDKPPRDDHGCPRWLTATEFEDEADVARAKLHQLAVLMRMSRKTVAYTGAGISAAVIGQAALSGVHVVGWKGDGHLAQPTFTHFALGLLGIEGLIHSWVQQNHDGLPQKAGFPQERINEIHGSWYDPSNPVVKYSGSLHDRAFPWMRNDADTADLVLVLGSSLGGLNADQVATKAAKRSLDPVGGLGTVMMNLQQTPRDGMMTLRLFGKSDDLLRILLQELGFDPLQAKLPKWPRANRALVPYDRDGRRTSGARMWLDFNAGQRVRITPGHNIQGAEQPQYMHIGASRAVKYNGETRQPGEGLGTVVKRDDPSASFILRIEGVQMRLGIWWLEAAVRGGVDTLPVVNQKPVFE